MPRIKSLGTLLIVSVTVTVFLGIAGILLFVTQSTSKLALELEQQAMLQAANNAQRGLRLYADGAASTIHALSTQRVLRAAFTNEPEPAQQRIGEMLKANPDTWSIIVFDTKGSIRAGQNAAGEDLTGQNRADRDYFKTILAGENTHLGKSIILSKSGGEDMFIFVAVQAIRDDKGTLLGGVGIFTRWTSYTDKFIAPLRFGEHGYAFMLDRSGKIIAHGADKALMLKSVAEEDFVKKALAQKNGELAYQWKGEEKYMTFATDEATGFTVCASAYKDDLTRAARSQRNILLGIGTAVLAALGLGITYTIRKEVVRPIQNMQEYASAVARGDYAATRHEGYRYELAALAGNLHGMVDQLKNRLGFAQGVLQGFVLPCAVFSNDNATTFVNQHMMQALEKSGAPESYYGKTSGEFIWGDPNRSTVSQRALAEGRTINAEISYPARSGEKIFDVTSTPIQDLDGNILGTLAVWFDLTEIRTQQRLIEEQSQRIAEAAVAANAVSDQVASASEELAAQIEQSGRGSEEQRSRTAEAATAMEQMNSTVMEVARSAGTAAELAERAKGQAQEGAGLVGEVVATIGRVQEQAQTLAQDMTRLGAQAQGINQIMDVISDIADQTNLLALNAAIEAARAGDAGRGFAVVADEVRKLAEKTMNATKQVGESIRAIQESAASNIKSTEATSLSIQTSTELAQRSGQALRQIVDMVDQTADQVRGIATASEEQSAASEEISRSTEDINRIAGETAEAMTQSRQAVGDLAKLASELRGIINHMNS